MGAVGAVRPDGGTGQFSGAPHGKFRDQGLHSVTGAVRSRAGVGATGGPWPLLDRWAPSSPPWTALAVLAWPRPPGKPAADSKRLRNRYTGLRSGRGTTVGAGTSVPAPTVYLPYLFRLTTE